MELQLFDQWPFDVEEGEETNGCMVVIGDVEMGEEWDGTGGKEDDALILEAVADYMSEKEQRRRLWRVGQFQKVISSAPRSLM